jgi:hypothetical protein
MPEIAHYEFNEQWGGQSASWTRLHNPACVISADYYGVKISGDWQTLSVDERRALVVVLESAVKFHSKQRAKVDKPTDDKNNGGVWTGKRYSDLGG